MENIPQWVNWVVIAVGGTSIGAAIYAALMAKHPVLAFWGKKAIDGGKTVHNLKHGDDEQPPVTKSSFDELMENVKADPFGTLDEIERRRTEASKLAEEMQKVHGELYQRMKTVTPELFEQAQQIATHNPPTQVPPLPSQDE